MLLLFALFLLTCWLSYWLIRLENEAECFGTLRYNDVFLLLALVKPSYYCCLLALLVVVVKQVLNLME